MQVRIYVCPIPGCGNYYGTDNMPDLHGVFTGPRTEDIAGHAERTGSRYKHTRAECPACRLRGQRVERELVVLEVPEPASVTPTPELPKVA